MSNPTPQENSLEMTDAPDLNTSVDGLALFTDISSGDIKDYQPVLYQINALTDMCDTLLSTKASGLVAAEEDLDLEALQAFRGRASPFSHRLNVVDPMDLRPGGRCRTGPEFRLILRNEQCTDQCPA